MTKGELIQLLEPLVDDVTVFVDSPDGHEYNLFGLRYVWNDPEADAYVTLTLGRKKDEKP